MEIKKNSNHSLSELRGLVFAEDGRYLPYLAIDTLAPVGKMGLTRGDYDDHKTILVFIVFYSITRKFSVWRENRKELNPDKWEKSILQETVRYKKIFKRINNSSEQ